MKRPLALLFTLLLAAALAAYGGSTDYTSEWSVARGTGRSVRIDISLTVWNGGDESIIQARTVGPVFYFRTIIDGRESRWMKLPADEVSGGLLGDFGNFDINIFLGPAAGRLEEWSLTGETTCRTGQCAILERPGGQVRKILVDKSTYDIVALVFPREGADGQPTEAVIQVFDRGKDLGISAPPQVTSPRAPPGTWKLPYSR